jgi:hypothetical protein
MLTGLRRPFAEDDRDVGIAEGGAVVGGAIGEDDPQMVLLSICNTVDYPSDGRSNHGIRSNASNGGTEQRADPCRQRHRERTPERYAHRTDGHACAADAGCQAAQHGEKH